MKEWMNAFLVFSSPWAGPPLLRAASELGSSAHASVSFPELHIWGRAGRSVAVGWRGPEEQVALAAARTGRNPGRSPSRSLSPVWTGDALILRGCLAVSFISGLPSCYPHPLLRGLIFQFRMLSSMAVFPEVSS